jgi:hypothetical protein
MAAVSLEEMWTRLSGFTKQMSDAAPAGMEAVVDVSLATGRTFRPGMVQLQGDGWFAFETIDDETGYGEILLLPGNQIVEIRCRFVPKGKAPIGFSVGEITGARSGAQGR